MSDFITTFSKSLRCRCPKCDQGKIFKTAFQFEPQDKCSSCGLNFLAHDNADGPAVFLIFILGFTLVPLALWVEFSFSPPLYVHAILWPASLLIFILGSLKPIKSYIMALQYKYRPETWEETWEQT